LIAGYKLGLVPARVIRQSIARVAFWGRDAAEIQSAGTEFAQQIIPNLMRPSMQRCIAEHKQQGDKTVVVSASLDVYLDVWCREQQLEVLCSRLEARAGVMTGGYVGADCCGPEKRRRVLAHYDLSAYEVVYAYGDTAEDEDLLSLAERRFFSRPRAPAGATRAVR
jgi:HAD superfamily phosphoserine phosphatase-like hydrolase